MQYQGIKITVITGFLGAGKTTAIQYMLSQVPLGESWAVLVNEFGDVGIDACLVRGENVQIKQVPGGCLCCTTSAAFSAGLNELIKLANPDRILIEPTGIGHPDQIVKQLQAPHYQGVLEIGASLCLVDARNLSNPRYLGHPAFFDQINMADVLVATKQDTYDAFDETRFVDFAKQFEPAKAVIGFSQQGVVDMQWLDVAPIHQQTVESHAHEHDSNHDHGHDHNDSAKSLTSQPLAGVTLFQKCDAQLTSLGWLMDENHVFELASLEKLSQFLQQNAGFWRAKGLLKTTDGQSVQLNVTATEASIVTSEVLKESRFECLFDAAVGLDNLRISISNHLF